MAEIVLKITPKNKEATQSVKLLNAEVQTLSKTLAMIKVNKNLTTQINALTKHYTALAKAAVRVNEVTTKRQIAEQRLANEVKRGRTEDQRTLQAKARREQAELRLKQAQDKATQSTQKQTTATKQNTEVNKEHRQSILSMTRGILEWQIATTLVMKPLRMLQNALTSINETLVQTEDAVIALQRVLPSGSASDGEISSRLYKIAADYGQTFDNVSQIAQNFARTGMSWADTIKATEAAVLALNVAELDAEEATTGLVAILSQFGLKASDLETVIDKLNKTADNFPVTTEKILAALQRTGSAADNANLSLDQTIALITALSKATGRSGENIGTALNSLIQYSSKASALDVFAGLSNNTANVVADYRKGAANILEVWQAVSAEIKNLSTEQANLLDSYFATEDGNALKEALDGELQDIYTELGGVYDTANTFRKNYFIALLGNMDTVEQAMGTLQGAAGYSQTENQKYLDTYTAKLNKLKAQWEEIANSEQGLLGIKKFFVDTASAILTASKWTGGLRTQLILVGSALATLFAPKILAGLGKIKTFFTNLSNPLKNFKIATQAATKAQQAQTLATNLQTQADRAAAVANQVRNATSASGAAIESAETAAIMAQTVATQAQTRADELAAQAAKAKGAAFQTVLGIIGIGITVISAVVGVFQEANRVAEENRKKQIENYYSIKDTYEELKKLSKEYNELYEIQNRSADQEKEFKDVEEKLVDVLKDKYKVLSLLKEGTEEYREAVKKLAAQEKEDYENQLINATKAAETELAKGKIGEWKGEYGDKNNRYANGKDVDLVFEILDAAGLKSKNPKREYLDLNDGKQGNNVADQLYNYSQYKKGVSALQNAYNEAIKQGDYYKADSIINSEAWEKFNAALDEKTVKRVKDYFDTKVALLTIQYEKQFGEVTTQEQFNALQTWVQNQINAGEFYNDTIKNVLAGLIDIKEEIPETVKVVTNNIQDVTGQYDNLISKLKELRDYEDESVNLEEKKAEYLEKQNELIKAQQALENAKNEATVRRFNSETGQWEWQVDEKKVQDAEEAVKKQEENVEKAREELEKQAYDTIIKQLEDKTATNDGLNELLNGLKEFLGDKFISDIKEAIKKDTNVDLDKPIVSSFEVAQNYINEKGLKESDREKWTEDKTFATLWNKLTDEERANLKGVQTNSSMSVNELIKKIFEPVPYEEFEKTAKGLGIIFESAVKSFTRPIIEHIGGNTNNSVDNSGQINFAGGLTVGADQRGSSIDQMLAMFGIMNNNG